MLFVWRHLSITSYATDEGLETNLASLPPVSQLSCESRDGNTIDDDDSQQVLADMAPAAVVELADGTEHDIVEAFSPGELFYCYCLDNASAGSNIAAVIIV